MPHPVHTSRRQRDGVYEIYYFDRLVGWVSQGSMRASGRPIWRALSTQGDLRHAHSLASARAAILEFTL